LFRRAVVANPFDRSMATLASFCENRRVRSARELSELLERVIELALASARLASARPGLDMSRTTEM
jgi:hypothetical protein